MSALARSERPLPVPNVEITRMRRRHLRKILSIEGSVYPRPWSAGLFLSEMAQRTTRSYIVARLAGEVVGYAGMMFLPLEAHVTNIAVDPDLQSQKIGSRLLLTIINQAVERGSDVISLEVRVSNVAAQAMYAKFGFSIAGVRKGYYIETREDAYVMEADGALSDDYRRRLQAISLELEEYEGGGT
ncbi:MAG: ribosomal protein S18-alanine N-acetyltransferase [Actinobacteria bacterium]|nr:ribosomal protein S18-alanine N-acetyltransferase [Actinomycetota bacterium]